MTTPQPTGQPSNTAGSPAANDGAPAAEATPRKVRGGSDRLPGERSAVQRVGGFVARHPGGIAKAIGLVLLAILVLQNLEPTSVDVLFWQVAEVPKLVLILGSMVVGGVAWELLRRSLRSR
jgi:hypothetical protein